MLRVRVVRALFAIGLLLAGAALANAQVDPLSMRSGVASGLGSATAPLYTVPGDSMFVLTDFIWTAAPPPLVPVPSPPRIQESAGSWGALVSIIGTGTGTRWSWNAYHRIHSYVRTDTACACHVGWPEQSPGVGTGAMEAEDHEWPIQSHWTTGLVFSSGTASATVAATAGPFGGPIPWNISWSGYLVPTSMTSSDVRDPLDLRKEPAFVVTPNPAGDQTHIRFTMGTPDRASLSIFDVGGRRVRSLQDADLGPGWHSVTWDGRDDHGEKLPEGVYFARLSTRSGERIEKVLRMN